MGGNAGASDVPFAGSFHIHSMFRLEQFVHTGVSSSHYFLRFKKQYTELQDAYLDFAFATRPTSSARLGVRAYGSHDGSAASSTCQDMPRRHDYDRFSYFSTQRSWRLS